MNGRMPTSEARQKIRESLTSHARSSYSQPAKSFSDIEPGAGLHPSKKHAGLNNLSPMGQVMRFRHHNSNSLNNSANTARSRTPEDERERERVAEFMERTSGLSGGMFEKRADSVHGVKKDSGGVPATGRPSRDDAWPVSSPNLEDDRNDEKTPLRTDGSEVDGRFADAGNEENGDEARPGFRPTGGVTWSVKRLKTQITQNEGDDSSPF